MTSCNSQPNPLSENLAVLISTRQMKPLTLLEPPCKCYEKPKLSEAQMIDVNANLATDGSQMPRTNSQSIKLL